MMHRNLIKECGTYPKWSRPPLKAGGWHDSSCKLERPFETFGVDVGSFQ